jgi:regulator of protease activity HflC (stomatin/prohibitin superfamily)
MSPLITIPNVNIARKDKPAKPPRDVAGGVPRARADARRYVNGVSIAVAVVVWLATLVSTIIVTTTVKGGKSEWLAPTMLLGGVVAGLALLFGIKVVDQWEKAVVLRFGKYRGLRGPGLFWIVPVVDVVSHLVDQRVRATDVSAESALTRDTVPVNVDAIVFWLVWDAQKAVLEVQSYFSAIFLSAQTALREAIGRHDLAEMITEREKLGQELAKILDEKTNPWGITVQSVEIRDVRIPAELEDAMSRRAQAERERQARIILGTAETEIAQLFAKASELYRENPTAMHLRAMNMLYEAIKEKGSMVIVPSSAVETMGLGGLLGTAAVAGGAPGKAGSA